MIVLRLLAGIGGAPVFIAGGVMAATLFSSDSSKNALAIALYFGGAGAGILLTALTLPPIIEIWGPASWPHTWRVLGGLSIASLVPAWWGAQQMIAPSQNAQKGGRRFIFPPWKKIIPSLAGYFFFAAGYIVYMTFVVAWRRVLAVYANGIPLALSSITTGIAVILPFAVPGWGGLLLSAVVFGVSFFIAPTAVTSFSKKNMPREQWSAAVALYTIAFAVGQTLGPIGAGWLADTIGNLSVSLWAGALVLFLGGGFAFFQRPISLPPAGKER